MAGEINIYGTLNNATPEGVLAKAEQVKDSTQNKKQSEINADYKNRIETLEQEKWDNIYVVGDVTSLTNESTPEEIMAVLGEPNKLREAVEGGKLICATFKGLEYERNCIYPIMVEYKTIPSDFIFIRYVELLASNGFHQVYMYLGAKDNIYEHIEIQNDYKIIPVKGEGGYAKDDSYTINKDTYDYLNTELFEKTHIYFTKGNVCDVTAETNGSDLMNIMGDYWTDDFDIQSKIKAGIQLFSIATDNTNYQQGLIPVTVSYYVIDKNITFSYIKNGKLVIFTTKITIDSYPNLGEVLTYKEIDLTDMLTKTEAAGTYATKNEIPDTSGFIKNTVDDLVNYYKKTEADGKFALKTDLSAYVTDEALEAKGYAKKADVPTKTSQLSNDSGYITAVPAEYVTDTELSETLGNYATSEQLSAKADKIAVQNVEGATPTQEIVPNKMYIFGEVTSLNITLGAETPNIFNEYMFQFTSGTTPAVLNLPKSVKWIGSNIVEANKTYQLSIVNNLAVMGGA